VLATVVPPRGKLHARALAAAGALARPLLFE
jgi:hypothetical protein